MPTKRFTYVAGLAVLAATTGLSHGATTAAEFQEEFEEGSPAAGWFYGWNNSGPLGASVPQALTFNPTSGVYETPGGSDASGDDLFVGPTSVYPGLAAGQDGNLVERYATVSYTIQPGDIAAAGGGARYEAFLSEYSFALPADSDSDSDGVNAAFFLNDTNLTLAAYGLPFLPFGPGESFSQAQFGPFPLGEVEEGDRITFAIGASGRDAFFGYPPTPGDNVDDEVTLDFTIALGNAVPEPAGLGVLALAGVTLLRRRRTGR